VGIRQERITDVDRKYLKVADEFEKRYVRQDPYEDRDIEKTLEIAWDLLSILPESELKRVKKEYISKYLPKNGQTHEKKEE